MIELNLHKLTTDIELNKMKFDFENTIEINHITQVSVNLMIAGLHWSVHMSAFHLQ